MTLDASVHYAETDKAYHVYLDEQSESIIHIPKNGWEFVEFSYLDLEIKEKLGSYKVESETLYKSKNFKIDSIYQNSNIELSLYCSCEIRRKYYHFTVVVSTSISYPSSCGISVKKVWDNDFPYPVNQVSINVFDYSKFIYGGGIQFSHCNLNGYKFPLIVEENGVGRGDKGVSFWAKLVGAKGNEFSSYSPAPIFLTNNNIKYTIGVPRDNSYNSVDFSNHNRLSFVQTMLEPSHKYSNPTIGVTINKLENPIYPSKKPPVPIYDNSFLESFLLDEWMYKYIFGVQGGKKRVDSLIHVLQDNDIEVGSIWIQDWVGKRQTSIGSRLQWDWIANEEVYPNLKQWIDSLHNEDIKVLGYINPYFVENGRQANEGLQKEVFVKNQDGSPYLFKAGGFKAYMLDFNNLESYNWIHNIIENNLVDNGFDGWMCDFGEWYPLNTPLKIDHSIKNSSRYVSHNLYPSKWYDINAQPSSIGRNELFIFNRAYYVNQGQYPRVMWLGDQMGSFGKNDGLASAVNAYNSASLSGYPLVHSDIGGYTAVKLGPFKYLRNDEVLQRWIEMEAFTPIWRSHEGLMPDKMSQIYQDQEMMQFFARFDSIHQSLIPYFMKVNKEYYQYGTPMILHPFLLYPDDQNTYDLQYQFFVGNDLLVCPVIEKGATSVKAYLPEGKWKHFFTNEIYEGGSWQVFDAPIGQPTAFWKANN